jgi:hypothetical protein
MVHIDFSVTWNKFLLDYEAVISNNKTAETILSEIETDMNVRKLERDNRIGGIQIDDSLLRQSYYQYREENNSNSNRPLPWENGWEQFVQNCNDGEELVGMKNKLKEKQQLRIETDVMAATTNSKTEKKLLSLPR